MRFESSNSKIGQVVHLKIVAKLFVCNLSRSRLLRMKFIYFSEFYLVYHNVVLKKIFTIYYILIQYMYTI